METEGITLRRPGCASAWGSKRGGFLSIASVRGGDGDAMPAGGHSKGTVHWCCQTKRRREAYCTSQVHLPNSSPESKKRETISYGAALNGAFRWFHCASVDVKSPLSCFPLFRSYEVQEALKLFCRMLQYAVILYILKYIHYCILAKFAKTVNLLMLIHILLYYLIGLQ